MGRFVWEAVETGVGAEEVADGLRGRVVALVGGRETEAYAVGVALRAAGARGCRLAPPRAGEGAGEGIGAFVDAAGGRIDGIVDLNLAEPFAGAGEPGAGPEPWEPAFAQTIALLQALYADWAAETDATRLFYMPVTRLGGLMGFGPAADSAGADSSPRIEQPLGGLWAGLAKGLPRELPNCNVRVLDLAGHAGAQAAGLVCRELYRWGAFEVGYREGRRYTLRARAARPAPPAAALGPGDIVVMSGGGRGIGFALARALAGDFGVRVVVSGRGPAPDPEATPELALTDADFRTHRDQVLRRAAAERRLPQARADLARLGQARELWGNLSGARRDGLRIDYVPCDVTDPAQVEALLAHAGDRLAGVVHDAGLDVPVRLPGKSPETVAAVVRVKVRGFLNLLRAVDARPLPAFFCNVGSLTGRWGGMVGQLDYGAANEALSRLGLWAAAPGPQPGRARRTPVTTVCWPTWERLGMITNYEATLRYMSAVSVPEALHHWQRELLAGPALSARTGPGSGGSWGGGEVTFIGDVGPAMVPSVLRGYAQDSGLPGIEGLVASRYWLGEPVRFVPYGGLGTVHRLDADSLPCADDFRVGGEPALPVSLLLELLHAAGPWVQPERADALALAAVTALDLDLGALRLARPVALTREAEGAWAADGTWQVSVTLRREGRRAASAVLAYGAAEAEPEHPAAPPGAEGWPLAAVPPGVGTGPSWAGHTVRLTHWRREPAAGRWYGVADGVRTADLLLASPAPGGALPLGAVENVLRAAWAAQARGAPHATRLTVDRLAFAPDGPAHPLTLLGTPGAHNWTGHRPESPTAAGPALRVSGLRLH